MKTLSLKSIVIAAGLLVFFSVGVQFFILRQVYIRERKQFDTQVIKSVNSLYQKRLLIEDSASLIGTSTQIISDCYLLTYDSIANDQKVIDALIRELSDFSLNCGFHFYVSTENSRAYSKAFEIESTDKGFKKRNLGSVDLLPPINEQHINLEFPGKKNFLLRKINPWILSSLFLVLSLAVIAFTLYHFYKHRFWNSVQKEFVNNFVHEFRTPLSVISIGSKVLQTNGIENNSTRLKKYARIIKEQTDQLQNKVNQILELALSGKKATYLEKEFVDVNTLIANAISLVEPLIEEKRATIEFIPSGISRGLNADGKYLTQAVVNLLDNSLKYANLPHIRLETGISEKKCFISIRDNGIGMEKKYFRHIFRKYYRIPTGDVHNVKGFGIGLNFVKNVVDAHNGQIAVSSIPGKGTELRIKLPLT